MRNCIPAIAFVLNLVSFGEHAFAEIPGVAEDAARKAATSWLSMVDAGEYSASWDELEGLFREKVTRAEWVVELTRMRESVGQLNSRSLIAAKYARNLPGAPEGEYVVVQYKSTFSGHDSVLETVVPMLGRDHTWRVSGYFIRGDVEAPTTAD
jgi:hypothetical protein